MRNAFDRLFNLIATGLGMLIIVAVIAGAAFVAVYAALGEFNEAGRHLIAAIEFFIIFAAFALGLWIGRAFRHGVERGLDINIGARTAVAALKTPAAAQPANANYSSLPNLNALPGAADVVVRHVSSDQVRDL